MGIFVLSPYPKISMPFIIGKISAASWHGVPRMCSIQLVDTFFHISQATSLRHKDVWTEGQNRTRSCSSCAALQTIPGRNNLFADLETGKASSKQNGTFSQYFTCKSAVEPGRDTIHMTAFEAVEAAQHGTVIFPTAAPFGRLLHVQDWDGVPRKDSSRGAWSSPNWLHCSQFIYIRYCKLCMMIHCFHSYSQNGRISQWCQIAQEVQSAISWFKIACLCQNSCCIFSKKRLFFGGLLPCKRLYRLQSQFSGVFISLWNV